MIQQWWSNGRDDADPVMKKTWRRRWLEEKEDKADKADKEDLKTWRLRRLEDEDDEMIQLMQRRRPVLKIVSKEYIPS